jgi:hypothetical protein
MQTVIIHNDLAAVRRLPQGSTDLLIIVLDNFTRTHERLAREAAQPVLREGGEVIIAGSLPQAFERL